MHDMAHQCSAVELLLVHVEEIFVKVNIEAKSVSEPSSLNASFNTSELLTTIMEATEIKPDDLVSSSDITEHVPTQSASQREDYKETLDAIIERTSIATIEPQVNQANVDFEANEEPFVKQSSLTLRSFSVSNATDDDDVAQVDETLRTSPRAFNRAAQARGFIPASQSMDAPRRGSADERDRSSTKSPAKLSRPHAPVTIAFMRALSTPARTTAEVDSTSRLHPTQVASISRLSSVDSYAPSDSDEAAIIESATPKTSGKRFFIFIWDIWDR